MIIINLTCNKRVVSKVYKEFTTQLSSDFKNEQRICIDIFPKKTSLVKKYMKRFSTSLIIRDMQIKTTMIHQLTPYHLTHSDTLVRMAITKKKIITNVGEGVEKKELVVQRV